MSRGFQTRFHQMRTSPRLSWRRSNDITDHSRRPNPNKEPKAASTIVSQSLVFSRILGFRPTGHIAPEFAKNHRLRIRLKSAGHTADSNSRSSTHRMHPKQATLGNGITGNSDHMENVQSKEERCSFCTNLKTRLLKPQGCAQPRRKHQPIQATTHHSNAIAPLE